MIFQTCHTLTTQVTCHNNATEAARAYLTERVGYVWLRWHTGRQCIVTMQHCAACLPMTRKRVQQLNRTAASQ